MTAEEIETMKKIGNVRMKMAKKAHRDNLNYQVKETAEGNKKLSRKEYKSMAKRALELALQNAIDLGKVKLDAENQYIEEEKILEKEEIEATVTVLETFLNILKKRSYL